MQEQKSNDPLPRLAGPSPLILTFDTYVAGSKVGHQVLATGLHAEQGWVGDCDGAALTSGASAVYVTQNIRGTSNKVVRGETATQPHASVPGRLHYDNLILCA